MNVSTRIAHI